MLQRGGDDELADQGLVGARHATVDQVLDLAARPQRSDARQLAGAAGNALAPGHAARLTERRRQQRPIRRRRIARRHHERLAGIKIRYRVRIELDGLGPIDDDVAERDVLELGEQGRHLLGDVGDVADVRVSAAAELRRLAHEIRVRRRADAHREQPCVAQALLDRCEQCRLGAHRAVGDEDDLTHVARHRRLRQRRVDGGADLRAAVGLEAVDVGERLRMRRR